MYQAKCVPLLKLHYGDDYVQGDLANLDTLAPYLGSPSMHLTSNVLLSIATKPRGYPSGDLLQS